MSGLVTDGLGSGATPLICDDLGGGINPSPPVTCFEAQQFPPAPLVAPTLSTLESEILTSQPAYPITNLFRAVFVSSCSTSTWNVAIARTVIFYANTTEIGNMLNQLYPGLHPNTGNLCQRVGVVALDKLLSPYYNQFSGMMNEMKIRNVPQPFINYLVSYNNADSAVYRVCDIAVSVVLGSILTLRG